MTNLPTAINQKQQLQTRSTAELMAGLGRTAESSATEIFSYLTFTGREGRYSVSKGAGVTPDPFPEGSEVYVNLFDTKQEYVCWKGGKLVDSTSCALFDQLPPIETMADHGPYSDKPGDREGWKKQYSIALRDVNSSKQYRLNVSAVSAIMSFDAFIKTVLEQSVLHDIKEETIKIKLGVAPFVSKGQRNYKPTFDLVAWVPNPKSPAEIAVAAATAPEEDEAPAKEVPATRRKG